MTAPTSPGRARTRDGALFAHGRARLKGCAHPPWRSSEEDDRVGLHLGGPAGRPCHGFPRQCCSTFHRRNIPRLPKPTDDHLPGIASWCSNIKTNEADARHSEVRLPKEINLRS